MIKRTKSRQLAKETNKEYAKFIEKKLPYMIRMGVLIKNQKAF